MSNPHMAMTDAPGLPGHARTTSGSLPRRAPAASFVEGELGSLPGNIPRSRGLAAAGPAMHNELAALRQRVHGVRGCVLATLDGLLLGQDVAWGAEPHDLAVLAASVFGVGRQCGLGLRQGAFQESTVRSQHGYFTVCAVGDNALLAVLGDEGLDLNWLHRDARLTAERIADLLHDAG